MAIPILGTIRRFRRDKSGLSAVEFALILPIMVVLYLGGFEVSEAVIINHKVTHATSVLGDLVAQTETITAAEMESILDAVSTVMAPYPVDDMTILVVQIQINNQGVAKVMRTKARNVTPPAINTVVTLPTGLVRNNTCIIQAEVHYNYTPTFGEVLTGGPIDLGETFYLRPREGTCVTW
jgi:Flp pilus assembly protein TadG